MKRCLKCHQVFADDYSYCLTDGSTLVSNESFEKAPTVVIPAQTINPAQQTTSSMLSYVAVGLSAVIIGGAIVAFFLYNWSEPAPNTNNLPVSQTAQNNDKNTSSNSEEKPDELAEQKEDLQKREEKVNREEERLKNAKKDLDAKKTEANNAGQTGETAPTNSTATIFAPPTNIRESPNGAVLCSVKKRTSITILGSTGIRDNNGEWYYTNACGKRGAVHSTQIKFNQ